MKAIMLKWGEQAIIFYPQTNSYKMTKVLMAMSGTTHAIVSFEMHNIVKHALRIRVLTALMRSTNLSFIPTSPEAKPYVV